MQKEYILPLDGPTLNDPTTNNPTQANTTKKLPQVRWRLELTCPTCSAKVEFTSLIETTFKLSRDKKTEKLLHEAEVWINHQWRGSPERVPEHLINVLELRNDQVSAYGPATYHYEIVPHNTRYVKCPVCRGRIYVC